MLRTLRATVNFTNKASDNFLFTNKAFDNSLFTNRALDVFYAKQKLFQIYPYFTRFF